MFMLFIGWILPIDEVEVFVLVEPEQSGTIPEEEGTEEIIESGIFSIDCDCCSCCCAAKAAAATTPAGAVAMFFVFLPAFLLPFFFVVVKVAICFFFSCFEAVGVTPIPPARTSCWTRSRSWVRS